MLSEKIINHLKQSSAFLAHVEAHENRRLLRHALGFEDDSKPRTERLAKEKGLPLYSKKIEGEKPLSHFSDLHADRVLYDAVQDVRNQGTVSALQLGVPISSNEHDGYFVLQGDQLIFEEH